MLRERFELVALGKGVNEVVRFGRGQVRAFDGPSFGVAGLLMTAPEMAMLCIKDHWAFRQDKILSLEGAIIEALSKALDVYYKGGNDNADSQVFS